MPARGATSRSLLLLPNPRTRRESFILTRLACLEARTHLREHYPTARQPPDEEIERTTTKGFAPRYHNHTNALPVHDQTSHENVDHYMLRRRHHRGTAYRSRLHLVVNQIGRPGTRPTTANNTFSVFMSFCRLILIFSQWPVSLSTPLLVSYSPFRHACLSAFHPFVFSSLCPFGSVWSYHQDIK